MAYLLTIDSFKVSLQHIPVLFRITKAVAWLYMVLRNARDSQSYGILTN